MDLEYLKDHICEELSDAKEYAKNAIELKPMTAQWAKIFAEMANNELTHASNLYRMFVEYYQKVKDSHSESPEYIEEMYKDIVQCYSTEYATLKYMLDLASK